MSWFTVDLDGMTKMREKVISTGDELAPVAKRSEISTAGLPPDLASQVNLAMSSAHRTGTRVMKFAGELAVDLDRRLSLWEAATGISADGNSEIKVELERKWKTDLFDKDNKFSKKGRQVDQNLPGRWTEDKDGPEAFLGWGDKGFAGAAAGVEGEYGHATIRAGVEGDYKVGVGINRNQAFIGADASVAVGVTAEARAKIDGKYASADAGADAFAGARANAGAELGWDLKRGHARAHAGVDAFAGAEVSADAAVNVAGLGVRGGVKGYAGIGVKADADIHFRAGKLRTRIELGAALGLGVGANVELEFDVDKAVNTVKAVGSFLNPFD